jgi:hypothetical protein
MGMKRVYGMCNDNYSQILRSSVSGTSPGISPLEFHHKDTKDTKDTKVRIVD